MFKNASSVKHTHTQRAITIKLQRNKNQRYLEEADLIYNEPTSLFKRTKGNNNNKIVFFLSIRVK